MGLLGDFLEAFYGSAPGFRSVRASLRYEETSTAHGDSSRRRPIGRAKPGAPKTSRSELEFWALLPDRVRVESTTANDGESKTTVQVVNGNECLKQSADGTIESESLSSQRQEMGFSLPTEFQRHFDAKLIRQFFASLTLEEVGACKIAERDCVQFRATPLPGDRIWPHWLPSSADEFRFAADLEFPSLLSIIGLLNGETVATLEVVRVDFKEEIDTSLFTLTPTSGQSIREAEPITQSMSIKAAVAKVPFTVLLPKSLSAESDPLIHYEPGIGRSSGESLMVMYDHLRSQPLWFKLSANTDSGSDESLEWETVEFSGRQFDVSDPKTEGGMIVLRFFQDGTCVEIYSDHALSDLLDIAMTFEAVTA